jgi:DNA repair protein RadC
MRMTDIPWWNRPGYKLSKDKELNDAELLAIILEKNKIRKRSFKFSNNLIEFVYFFNWNCY